MAIQREQRLIDKFKTEKLTFTKEAEIFLRYILENGFQTISRSRSQYIRHSQRFVITRKDGKLGRYTNPSDVNYKIQLFEEISSVFMSDLENYCRQNYGEDNVNSTMVLSFLRSICPRWPFC